MTVLRIVSPVIGEPSDIDGRWLKAFDPDARDGRGMVQVTSDRAMAMQFEDAGAAMACWRQQSKVRPVRPDGKPNRPLTAYTIEIEN